MYVESTHKRREKQKQDLVDMGVAAIERRTKRGKTSGFLYIQARITAEEEEKIKKILQEHHLSAAKHLFRPIIRWLPKSGCRVEGLQKSLGSDKIQQFRTEVTPEEKEIIVAFAAINETTVTDVLRWIIHNLGWISKEI